MAAAKAAYEGWRLYPAPKRAELLYRVVERPGMDFGKRFDTGRTKPAGGKV